MSKQVKIVVTVPLSAADKVRESLGIAGAGVQGNYSYCSYSVVGQGRFLAGKGAKPHTGKIGEFENVNEERIEVTCDRDIAKEVIGAVKAVHPYEEVAFDVYTLLSEDDL